MSAEVLALFSADIWSTDADTRLAASEQLIHHCLANSDDIDYAVKRLLRGLASSQEASRLSFAVILSELLKHSPTAASKITLQNLLDATPCTTSAKGAEERDLLFARLFGLYALGQHAVSTKNGGLFGQILAEFNKLLEIKPWARQPVGWVVMDLIGAAIGTFQPEQISQIVKGSGLFAKNGMTLERLAWALKLQQTGINFDWQPKTFNNVLAAPSILAKENLTSLASIFRAAKTEDNDANAVLSNETKPHFIWQLIFDDYFGSKAGENSRGKAIFLQLYTAIVEEALAAENASNPAKHSALLVFQQSLNTASTEIKAQLFSPNVHRLLMILAGKKDQLFSPLCQSILEDVVKIGKTDSAFAFALIDKLAGKSGPLFDAATKTKTVEQLMGCLREEQALQLFTAYRKSFAIVESAADEPSETEAESKRRWAIDQSSSLVKALIRANLSTASKAKGARKSIPDWIRGLAVRQVEDCLVIGLFSIKKAAKKSSIAALRVVPEPAVSDKTRDLLLSRGQQILNDLDQFAADQPEMYRSLCEALIAAGKLATPAHSSNATLLVEIEALCEEIGKFKSQLDQSQTQMIQQYAYASAVFTLGQHSKPESRSDILQSAKDLLEAYSSTPMETSDDEEAPEPSVVLINSLVEGAKLQLPTNVSDRLLRSLATSVDKTAVDFLVESITGAQAEAEDERDESDSESSPDSEDSQESANSEDEENQAEVDPALLAELEAALASVNGINARSEAAQDGDSSDEEVFNDEQMMAIDEQLSAAFRAHAASRPNRKETLLELVQSQTRLLDFVEILLESNPTSENVPSLFQLLFDLTMATDESKSGTAKSKAARILRSFVSDSSKIAAIPTADAEQLLQRVHEMARTSASREQIGLCSTLSLFLGQSVASNSPAIIQNAYISSTEHFVSKKASTIQPEFISAFIKRHSDLAFGLMGSLLKGASTDAVTTYRRGFSIDMLRELVKVELTNDAGKERTQANTPELSQTLFAALKTSNDKKSLSGARLKDAAKAVLSIARLFIQSDASSYDQNWRAPAQQLIDEGQISEKIKNIVQQITTLSQKPEKRRRTDAAEPAKKRRKQAA